MGKFCEAYGDHQLSELTVDTILDFLNQLTDGCKPQTKRIRYGHLAAFFNFIKNNIISDFNGKYWKKRPLTKSSSEPPIPEIVCCLN